MEAPDSKGSGGRGRRGSSAGFGRCGRWDQMGETPGFVCQGEGGCARLVGEAAGAKADEWTDGQQGQSFVGRWLTVPARRSMRRDFTRFPTSAAAPADGPGPTEIWCRWRDMFHSTRLLCVIMQVKLRRCFSRSTSTGHMYGAIASSALHTESNILDPWFHRDRKKGKRKGRKKGKEKKLFKRCHDANSGSSQEIHS